MIKIRNLATAAISLLAVSAAVIAVPSSASASGLGTYCATLPEPANLCAEIISISTNVVTIRAYPPNYTFYGHFELQTPNHRTLNSITSTWNKGGVGNYFNNINGGIGTYCVHDWTYIGGGWETLGGICFTA